MTSDAQFPAVSVKGLTKRFRRGDKTIVKAVDDVSFDVAPGEFVVLLGPSGCGKTTLLRSIAGLEQPDEGTIDIAGRRVFDGSGEHLIPTEQRRISMVFQSYALWPHMTIARNVGYPLHCTTQLGRQDIADRVDQMLAQVGLREVAGQYPGQISGGQQQRAALARALIAGNDLILFDEPLSNVDAKVRDQLRDELLDMQLRFGFAAVYVTHDQAEAMQLADRIAVLGDGRIQQIAAPLDVYRRPTTRYVANFVGTTNELPGRVRSVATDRVTLSTAWGELHGIAAGTDLAPGDDVVALWRPEDTRISADQTGRLNVLAGVVGASSFLGAHVEETLAIEGATIRRTCDFRDALASGTVVTVTITTAKRPATRRRRRRTDYG
jgi:iron(III) transport system ATP-binding protein